jgi:hypothetical protein
MKNFNLDDAVDNDDLSFLTIFDLRYVCSYASIVLPLLLRLLITAPYYINRHSS